MEEAMSEIPVWLAEAFRSPESGERLVIESNDSAAALVAEPSGDRAFPVMDGIPVLLASEAYDVAKETATPRSDT